MSRILRLFVLYSERGARIWTIVYLNIVISDNGFSTDFSFRLMVLKQFCRPCECKGALAQITRPPSTSFNRFGLFLVYAGLSLQVGFAAVVFFRLQFYQRQKQDRHAGFGEQKCTHPKGACKRRFADTPRSIERRTSA